MTPLLCVDGLLLVMDVVLATLLYRAATAEPPGPVVEPVAGYQCECGVFIPEDHWTGPWDERWIEGQYEGVEVAPGCPVCGWQTRVKPKAGVFSDRIV